MKLSHTFQLAAVLALGSSGSIVIADEVASKKAKLIAATAERVVTVPKSHSVKSGLLFSIGKSEIASFDVADELVALGFSGVTGGSSDEEIGWSLGYRHALGARWSIDTQYVRQNESSDPIGVTVIAGTEAAAAQNISNRLPKLAQGISVAGLYHAPLTHKLSSHIGAGVFIWRGERETRIGAVTATDKESGTDVMLQLGLGYRVTPNVAIEGSVQRFFMPDEAVNRLSLGMVYSFR